MLLGPMKLTLLQDEQTQLPQPLLTGQALQPLPPWWIPRELPLVYQCFFSTGEPETGRSINSSSRGINGSHQQGLFSAKCPSP